MYRILLANKNEQETIQIASSLKKEFNIIHIQSPININGSLDHCDAILLDHNFTQNQAIDFLMEIVPKTHVPIIMLTSLNDSKSALEAMKIGAFNYLIKTQDYIEIIGPSLMEAIRKYNEKEQLLQTILELKRRNAELSKQLKATEPASEKKQEPDQKRDLIQLITLRFRRGEVNLPSYPQINLKFKELLREGASIPQLSELLKKDPSISSKLISVSNSPFYRGLSENKTLEQAVSRLGLTETKNVVAIITNRSLFTAQSGKYREKLENLWKHSLACAHACQMIAKAIGIKVEDEIFTMGLLHDIGKLILLQVVSELETEGALQPEAYTHDLWDSLFKYHGKFGAALLSKWKFDKEYSVISMYHGDISAADNISKNLLVVNLGNILAKKLAFGENENSDIDLKAAESSRLLKIDPDEMDLIIQKTSTFMQENLFY